MSNVKYDIKRVPRELLETYTANSLVMRMGEEHDPSLGSEVLKIAFVPLRTKAEIDADIAKAVRDYADEYNSLGQQVNIMDLKFKGCFGHPSDQTLPEVLKMLLMEETSD